MKTFSYYQPTEIRFGRGRLAEVGQAVSRWGLRVPKEELEALAIQSLVLLDYKNHPRTATHSDVLEILGQSH